MTERTDAQREAGRAYMREYRGKKRQEGGDVVNVVLTPAAAAALKILTRDGVSRTEAVDTALIDAALATQQPGVTVSAPEAVAA